jgi:membrane-bound lytic murein transglycosylase A
MRSAGWLVTALALAACAVQTPPAAQGPSSVPAPALALTAVPFSAVPGWTEDHLSAAIPPLRRECAQLATQPQDAALGGDGTAARLGGSAGQWRSLCAAAATIPAGDDVAARAMLERELQPYAMTGNGQAGGQDDGQAQVQGGGQPGGQPAVQAGVQAGGLFTGYYEPQVDGATMRGGRYQTPLLRRPRDLVQADLGAFASDLKGRSISGREDGGRLVPYYDRAAIERGALASQRLALLFLIDPIDAFFLEVQGSGRVRLPDGRIVRVSYDGQNGRPYVPIGRLLIERGELTREAVSLQTIRAWLVAHPDQAPALMDANPSYVFFTTLPNTPPDQGAPGSLGVALTPGRSLAVDPRFVPMGAPVFVATSNPLDGARWRHLLLAQDRGGAIKGPVRGDIFFGWGAEAEAMAGRMKQHGTAYLLLPRAVPGA